MKDDAVAFIIRNMKVRTVINEKTGERTDKTEYPIVAIREIILNALIHRDYSIHTGNDPLNRSM